MSVYELRNSTISVKIDSHGAELKSLQRLDTGTEYMWCGDAKYWGRTSPVLFPFVGGVKNREYRVKGKTYSMGQHGSGCAPMRRPWKNIPMNLFSGWDTALREIKRKLSGR